MRAFWAAQGPQNPGRFFLLRVTAFLLRVLGFGRNPEGFLFKGFWVLRKVFCSGFKGFGPSRAQVLAFQGFLGRPRPPKPEKFICLRVKVFLLRVLRFGHNRKGFFV